MFDTGVIPRVAALLPAGVIPRVASLLPAGVIPRVAALLPAGVIPRVAALLPAGLLTHHDDVRVGAVPQKARQGGLGQHQQLVGGGQFGQQLATQPGHPQPAGLIEGRRSVGDGTAQRTEQHEVAVSQPAEQIGGAGPVGAGEPRAVVGVHGVGQFAERGRERGRILGDLACIREHHRQQPLGFGQRPAVGGGQQLHMDPGLIESIRTAADFQQLPG